MWQFYLIEDTFSQPNGLEKHLDLDLSFLSSDFEGLLCAWG